LSRIAAHLAHRVAAHFRRAGDGGRGLAGFSVIGWNALVAPKGTPSPVIAKLNSAMMRGLDDGDLRHRLAPSGHEPPRNSPDDFARFIQANTTKWVALVEQTR
jgi:tripartite-type tricarboxylate transporter receptor subunit TctC